MLAIVRYTFLLILVLSVVVSSTTIYAHVQNQNQTLPNGMNIASLEKISFIHKPSSFKPSFDLFSVNDSLRSHLGALYGFKPKIDSARASKILAIKGRNDDYEVSVELAQDQSRLDCGAYNLFGKRVMDIYVTQSYEKAGRKTFTFNTAGIPNGMYLCVVQGNNFRIAEKFQISR